MLPRIKNSVCPSLFLLLFVYITHLPYNVLAPLIIFLLRSFSPFHLLSQDLLHCFLLSQECTPNIDGADSISTGKRTHDDYVNIIKFFLWCHSIRNRWLETWKKLPSIYLLGVLFFCFSIELHVYKNDVVHFLFLSNNNSREKGKKVSLTQCYGASQSCYRSCSAWTHV